MSLLRRSGMAVYSLCYRETNARTVSRKSLIACSQTDFHPARSAPDVQRYRQTAVQAPHYRRHRRLMGLCAMLITGGGGSTAVSSACRHGASLRKRASTPPTASVVPGGPIYQSDSSAAFHLGRYVKELASRCCASSSRQLALAGKALSWLVRKPVVGNRCAQSQSCPSPCANWQLRARRRGSIFSIHRRPPSILAETTPRPRIHPVIAGISTRARAWIWPQRRFGLNDSIMTAARRGQFNC